MKKKKARYAAALLYRFSDVLSDEDAKKIRTHGGDDKDIAAAIIEHGPPFTKHEIQVLVEAHNDQFTPDAADDTVLDKLRELVHNYPYTYNDEAKKVDKSIDTQQEYIGPMAQDLEKVAPGIVKEDDSGYKVVDPGRLAMLTVGAVADLAREVEELKHGV